jgi:hypothetical protein
MLSYDKWKLLNETLGGSTVLGLSQKQSLGLVSNIPGIAEGQWSEKGCGEGDEDGEEEVDGAVDLEDYSDEYDDTEEIEDEVDAEDEEIDDDDEEDEEEYDDETEGEEDDDMPEEEEEDEEDEEESDSDGDEEWEDEDEEYEDEDSDGDPTNSEMGMGTGTYETKRSGDKVITESDWWQSVTNQIGKMTPSGNVIIEEQEEEEVEVLFNKLPSDVRGPMRSFISRLNPEAGEQAGRSQLFEMLETLMEIALNPMIHKGINKSQVASALLKIAKNLYAKHAENPKTDSHSEM